MVREKDSKSGIKGNSRGSFQNFTPPLAEEFRGIWYSNQPLKSEYKYKYSGGLGTYCAKHIPFAVYSEKSNKTFFTYGGTADDNNELLHVVSYFDHETNTAAPPRILLNKKTNDAHDNPVISIDGEGYIWIFSSSHGAKRPSYIHKSTLPYSINGFRMIEKTNFSYPQIHYIDGFGFFFFFTKYINSKRALFFKTSSDGLKWSESRMIALIKKGHYQISNYFNSKKNESFQSERKSNITVTVGTAFNYHPKGGLNYRTNLYYIETRDLGQNWVNINGESVKIPIKKSINQALVYNYEKEHLLVYLKDINYDQFGNPVILYITSPGHESGPKNDPRYWMIALWHKDSWKINRVTQSDSNYDTGSLYIDDENKWYVIGPTESGPQPYNPGGEIAILVSNDCGKTWNKEKQVTTDSKFNHTYLRRPVNAHEDFYGIWADGNPRENSKSNLYFVTKSGKYHKLKKEERTMF